MAYKRGNIKTHNQTLDELLNSQQYEIKILWTRVPFYAYFHAVALYGLYLCFISTSWKTMFFAFVLERIVATIGFAAHHKFWCHRAFKAKLPLRIFMCISTFALGQGNILHWSRDHRAHHKFADTNADPHNINRGFFFAHIGWLLCKKHPAVIAGGSKLPMDDLLADPVVRFSKKYYYPMWILFCFILPTIIPVYFWGEEWLNAYCVTGVLKYIIQCHCSSFTNSVGHAFGYRPYDKNVEARESMFVETFQPGEGSHNYHHAFPRDYKTNDNVLSFNGARFFIEFMASIGQAYDLKLSSDEMIKAKKLNVGNNSI